MLWKLLVASLLLGSACAVHLEYLKVDSAEEPFDGTLSSDQDQDLLMPEDQLPGLCWVCEWTMKKLKKQLSNNANEGLIKAKVLKVCDSVGFLRSLCKKMVNKYLDILVEELSTTDDPQTICANIGICKSADMLELIQVFQQNKRI